MSNLCCVLYAIIGKGFLLGPNKIHQTLDHYFGQVNCVSNLQKDNASLLLTSTL